MGRYPRVVCLAATCRILAPSLQLSHVVQCACESWASFHVVVQVIIIDVGKLNSGNRVEEAAKTVIDHAQPHDKKVEDMNVQEVFPDRKHKEYTQLCKYMICCFSLEHQPTRTCRVGSVVERITSNDKVQGSIP